MNSTFFRLMLIALCLMSFQSGFAEDVSKEHQWKKDQEIEILTKRHLISKNTLFPKREDFDRKSTEKLTITIGKVEDNVITEIKYELTETNDKDKSILKKVSLVAKLEAGKWEIYDFKISPITVIEEYEDDEEDVIVRTRAIEKARVLEFSKVNFKLHTGFQKSKPSKVGQKSNYVPTFSSSLIGGFKDIVKKESSAKLVKEKGDLQEFDLSFKEDSKYTSKYSPNDSTTMRDFIGQMTLDTKTGLCKKITSTSKLKAVVFNGMHKRSATLKETSELKYKIS